MTLEELISARSVGEPIGLGDSPEARFLAEAVDRYLAIATPFDGVLEAPEAVGAAYARHGEACGAAAHELRRASRSVLEEVLAALPPR